MSKTTMKRIVRDRLLTKAEADKYQTVRDAIAVELQHEPGPWHVGGKNNQIVYSKSGDAIANACTFHGKFGLAKQAAHARIIAAAPELAIALQNALETIKTLDDQYQDRHDYQTGMNLLQRIANA